MTNMKNETFIAIIIESGRVTIPEWVRTSLNVKEGQKVRITVEVVGK